MRVLVSTLFVPPNTFIAHHVILDEASSSIAAFAWLSTAVLRSSFVIDMNIEREEAVDGNKNPVFFTGSIFTTTPHELRLG